MTYNIREANVGDIRELFSVRMSVKENVLNTPALVTDEICADYLVNRGKGWLCEVEGAVVGFAIADVKDNSVWALFLRPEFEGRGIGKRLHDIMLDWYFSLAASQNIWLTTEPNTRAEKFYARAGWQNMGKQGKETRFEMSKESWLASKAAVSNFL